LNRIECSRRPHTPAPECDDDCTHGRWYIHKGELLCDRICIHVVDDFKCPWTEHDTTIARAATLATLDKIEKNVSERISELKSWLVLELDKEKRCSTLAVLGENQAMWAYLESLRAKPEES
jgi:hypothetical protein